MKIAVCIKQVPTRDWQPKLTDDRSWIREQDATYEMNEPDAYALEEALRLREKHSGEVVVCSAGPARVQQVIREALARGADRAIHVEDETLGAADAMVAASALAAAMNDEQFDLVLTGRMDGLVGVYENGGAGTFSNRSAAAASAEPPPRPAATGIRFSRVTAAPGTIPAAAASAQPARSTRLSASGPAAAAVGPESVSVSVSGSGEGRGGVSAVGAKNGWT